MTNLVCTCYQQTPQDGWFFKFRILTLTEMPQHFVRAKCPHTKKYRYVDKLTWKHHFLAELQEPSRWRTERSKNHEQTHSSVVQKLRFEFNIDFKHPGVSLCMLQTLFKMWNYKNYSSKSQDNSKCKCDQGKAILDGIEFRVSKIIYNYIYIKVYGPWGWGLVCASVSVTILRTKMSQIHFPAI